MEALRDVTTYRDELSARVNATPERELGAIPQHEQYRNDRRLMHVKLQRRAGRKKALRAAVIRTAAGPVRSKPKANLDNAR